MNDNIRLPRSALDKIKSVVQRGVLVSLLEKADESGRLTISVRGFADEIGISYQVLRTTLAKLSDNAIINATSTQTTTQRLTQITICDYGDCNTSDRKGQRKGQRKSNAVDNATTTVIPDYISPPFVAHEFADIWHKFMEYRKEIKKPYRSESSERTAYNKMVEMSNNDPATARDMVERTILGQWQGLFPIDKNGTKPITPTDNAATRKALRDRGLSLATEIVARSENLLNLYNGEGSDPNTRKDQE